MNEIQRLIHEMCPDGVPMVAFDSCATYTRGVTYNKKQESDLKDPSANKILRANNITLEANRLNFNDIKYVKSEVKIRQDQWLIAGDILICAGSGSKEHIGKVAYVNEDIKYSFGGFMAVIRPQSNTISRYLFHNLIGRTFKDYLSSALNSTTINNLNSSVMNGYEIPLPPLPIQQRIVEILDKFTSLVSSLDSEIALRQKQYEYYRNKLLSFEEGDEGVEWKKIIEFADLKAGKAISASELSEIQDGSHPYPCFGGNGIRGYIAKQSHSGEYAIIGRQGALCGCVNWATGDFYATEHAVVCTPSRLTDTKYLFYLFENADLNQFKSQGAQPGLAVSNLNELVYPIPPLDKQRTIVRTLDTFESLLTNLKKERELRQKQYEYYREKLLTFA